MLIVDSADVSEINIMKDTTSTEKPVVEDAASKGKAVDDGESRFGVRQTRLTMTDY